MTRFYGSVRTVGTSAANSAQTVSADGPGILRQVTVKYSGSVSQTVTVTLDSGAGAGYDTLLQNITLSSATDGVFLPDADIVINTGDQIDVTAPAGGAGVTSAVTVYLDKYR